jgi:hypothetical protein
MAEHSGRFAITPARNVDDDRLLGAARPNDKAIDYDAEAGGAPASFGGHRYFSDSASRPETEAAESASLPPARYDAMCRAIDAAYEVDEVKDIRDKAIALEVYSKQARNKEAERRAREIRLRAERKVGKLLRAMKKAKGAAQPGIGRAGGTRSDGPTALRERTVLQLGRSSPTCRRTSSKRHSSIRRRRRAQSGSSAPPKNKISYRACRSPLMRYGCGRDFWISSGMGSSDESPRMYCSP